MKTFEDYLPCKIRAGNDSKEIQEMLFKLGCVWYGRSDKSDEVQYEYLSRFLFIDKEKNILRGDSSYSLEDYITRSENEITVNQLFEWSKNVKDKTDPLIKYIKDECDFGCKQKYVVKIVSKILERVSNKN